MRADFLRQMASLRSAPASTAYLEGLADGAEITAMDMLQAVAFDNADPSVQNRVLRLVRNVSVCKLHRNRLFGYYCWYFYPCQFLYVCVVLQSRVDCTVRTLDHRVRSFMRRKN